ncbi:hypothetical protein CANARDRAFT_5242 [[Candida] arabinofermentans NRRL YB-2248]|uniref:TLC domain-containing protein n=1 Tax=[Candida] arabinofermentans NRRL YB-2248 TaxID=983967 RepID=A0A1E4T862_9ASCO|nr:hypothetical protein CANARDRAFT_5242 [[Candida] arabinofermentans NRRL YB-2248]
MNFISDLIERHTYSSPLDDTSIQFPYLKTHIEPFIISNFPNHISVDSGLFKNINTILLGILVYHSIYTVSKIPVYFSKTLQNVLKGDKSKIDFCMRITSFIQATVICALGLPLYNNDHLNKHRVFATTPYSEFYICLALSYFIWDALMSFYYLRLFGLGFLIHGIVSALVFFSASYASMIHYYSPLFLLFEISTPFLNIRWFGLKFKDVIPEWFQLLNNIILILIFFFIRICWGWYQVFWLAVDLWEHKHDDRFVGWVATIILSCNFVLDILNVFWFSKMMTVAITTIRQMIGKAEKNDNDEKLKLM